MSWYFGQINHQKQTLNTVHIEHTSEIGVIYKQDTHVTELPYVT